MQTFFMGYSDLAAKLPKYYGIVYLLFLLSKARKAKQSKEDQRNKKTKNKVTKISNEPCIGLQFL